MRSYLQDIIYRKYRAVKDWIRYLGKDLSNFKYVYPYLRSRNETPLQMQRPWMVIEAVGYIENCLDDDWSVFEWGSGGSTVFFAERVDSVYSVEHDREWYEKLRDQLENRHYPNVEFVHIPPQNFDEASIPDGEVADFQDNKEPYTDLVFENYVKEIDRSGSGDFDCVIVDGRARPSCIIYSISKIRPGGLLVVDNSEREAYKQALRRVESWKSRHFYGPVYCSDQFSQTSIFRKPRTS